MLYPHYPSAYLLIYFILDYVNTFSHFLVMKLLDCLKQEGGRIHCFHGKAFEFAGL